MDYLNGEHMKRFSALWTLSFLAVLAVVVGLGIRAIAVRRERERQHERHERETHLHIDAVDGCNSEEITGSLGDKTYRLSPVRPETALGVGCYMPVKTEDVGHDLDASLDVQRGVIRVHSPIFDNEAMYTVEAASERK